jgi:PAS domain S-box-containing protein
MELENAWLKKRPEAWMTLLGLAGVLFVDLLDYLIRADVRFAILYLVPIMACAWFGGLRPGIVVVLAAAISRLLLEIFVYPTIAHPQAPYFNFFILAGVFSIVAILASSMRDLLARSEERVADRTVQLQKQITERKHAEGELRASEERFRQLTDNIREVFWMTNADKSEVIYVSPGYESIWGRTCQSLRESPRSWLDAIEPEHRERVSRGAMNQRAGLYDEQYRIVRPDGSRRWIRDRGFPVYDVNGNVYRIAGVADDITVQKVAEEALSKSELQLRMVWENSLDGMRLMDENGTFIAVNETYCRLVELPRERLVGSSLAAIFPEHRREHILQRHRERFRNRSVPAHSEDELELWNGKRVCLEISSSFLETPESPTLLLGIFREITEKRRLEKQLLEISDREQARIGHDLHDELCQFLVGILFHCQDLSVALRRSQRPEASAAEQVAQLIDSAITQARQLARGLFPVLLEREGLVPALQEFALGVNGRSKTQCSVQCDQPVSIPQKFVANHLYRIAQEAVNNAAHHAQARQINIYLGASDSTLELTITDDGVGMKQGWSQGMGLHIMNYRAHSIGGSLQIESRDHGGTTVVCRVPLKNCQEDL